MELSIDTASALTSVAVSDDGELIGEITWQCARNHSVELLPTIERVLAQASVAKSDLNAVFVCTGPGGYTGLRVGMAVAKGLAYARRLEMVGVGRLELDAYPHSAYPGPVVAVHRAGRGEFAWATYRGEPWREVSAPALSSPDEVAAAVTEATLVVGEVDEKLRAALEGTEAVFAPAGASVRRAGTLAALGHERLARGEAVDPAVIAPLYLRPPAIGPQQHAGG